MITFAFAFKKRSLQAGTLAAPVEKIMTKRIGKVVATEKAPSTVDEFYFWTSKTFIIKPFDVIKVGHIESSVTFGVVEEIPHQTDSTMIVL